MGVTAGRRTPEGMVRRLVLERGVGAGRGQRGHVIAAGYSRGRAVVRGHSGTVEDHDPEPMGEIPTAKTARHGLGGEDGR